MPCKASFHDTNQTDKEREQKLSHEAAVIGELKRKNMNVNSEHWEGEESLNITNINMLIRFNKTGNISQRYPSFKHSPNSNSHQCKCK